jgi:hypothetical protein
MLLVQLRREVTEARGASTTDHRCIFIAELDKLFTEALLLLASAMVARVKKAARANTAGEPLTLGELDNDRAEDVHHFGVTELFRYLAERTGGLVADDSLVSSSEILQKRQEERLVRQKVEAHTKFLRNSKKDFVVFVSDEILQVGDQLVDSLFLS